MGAVHLPCWGLTPNTVDAQDGGNASTVLLVVPNTVDAWDRVIVSTVLGVDLQYKVVCMPAFLDCRGNLK